MRTFLNKLSIYLIKAFGRFENEKGEATGSSRLRIHLDRDALDLSILSKVLPQLL